MNSTKRITIKAYKVGELQTNCYVVIDEKTKDTVIIDPGDVGGFIAEQIELLKGRPLAICLTHGHFDHCVGAFELQHIYTIPCFMNTKDQFLVDRMVKSASYFLGRTIIEPKPTITAYPKNSFTIGSIQFKLLSAPGHTPGGVALYMKDAKCVFTGDTLFSEGLVGRTDLAYSSKKDLDTSIDTIFTLPDTTILYPGHGESSIIENEKIYWKLTKTV